ncbi:MAG: DUF2062 domain-containing protein [Hyphomicrobiales bacterium]
MLFSRRNKPKFGSRLQSWIWPRGGWRRAGGYMWYRVSRLSGSPHAIAIGFSAGVFASFTPFMGFHFMIGFFAAYLLGGSLIASAFGTFAGNPVTFPFIWIVTFKFGSYLLGMDGNQDISIELPGTAWWLLFNDPQTLWEDFWSQLWPVIRPMTIGGLPLGIMIGSAVYFPVRLVVSAYQRKRRERLARATRPQSGSSNQVNA